MCDLEFARINSMNLDELHPMKKIEKKLNKRFDLIDLAKFTFFLN